MNISTSGHEKRSKLIRRIQAILVIWTVGACVAYLVQKATVNYSFDWSCWNDLAYRNRFAPLIDQLAECDSAYLIIFPPGKLPAKERWDGLLLQTRYLLTPFWTQNDKDNYIIADFHRPLDPVSLAKDKGWILIKSNGNQAALFVKAKPVKQ